MSHKTHHKQQVSSSGSSHALHGSKGKQLPAIPAVQTKNDWPAYAAAIPQKMSFTKPGVAQFTLFSMGDDPKLAAKDMASFSKRTGEDIVEVPIPKMKDEDALMYWADSPIVIFMHGSTLKTKYTVSSFVRLLRSKGYVRSADKEIVFITCGAADILAEKGQRLANELNAIIHLAKGNVYVNEGGIPSVTIKKKDVPPEAIAADYSDSLGRVIPKEAEGWTKFEPHMETLFAEITRELKVKLAATQNLWLETTAHKEEAKTVIDSLSKLALELEETLASVRTGRETLDDIIRIEYKALAEKAEKEKEEKRKKDEEERSKASAPAKPVAAAGNGWDLDFNL